MITYRLVHRYSGYWEPMGFATYADADKQRMLGADSDLWEIREVTHRRVDQPTKWNSVLDWLVKWIYKLRL